ncbi:MAG: AAA family ATPase, partial [Dermatophilaceae bacterium]
MTPDALAAQIAVEQGHVDLVYRELTKATERALLVEAEGLARGRTDRTGDVRDEEITGLFERDALVFNANKRRATLETQYEGLVFGRLDLDHDTSDESDRTEREIRYIGRLGVRDDDYEPLVIDWRAPAAAPFYRSTPVEPMGVVRRRVLRCKGSDVVGIEDDLMVPEAPEDLVVVGDGALMAALSRTRGARMRDIVATIQRHQDEAIRAPARGVTEISGGPGTGKTVVALHRAAYLLYSDRRRYESGGILVVGPSAAYTAYIERVLPSLGEDTVTLRSLGDVVDGVTTERLDTPAAAAIKGSMKIRRILARVARDAIPDTPTQLRAFIAGRAIRLDSTELDRVRTQVLRVHQRNLALGAATQALAEAAWASDREGDRSVFMEKFLDHRDVETFMRQWWRPVDAREVLLWLADPERTQRYAAGVLSQAEATVLSDSVGAAIDTGAWSVADVALIDDIASRIGPMREPEQEDRGFYEIDDLDDTGHGTPEVTTRVDDAWRAARAGYEITPHTMLERLMKGRLEQPVEYAHVLIDEAQDISPMQWRMLGRRGRWSSWTVVGDAAQASWPDAAEAALAREQAFGSQVRSLFHM